MNRACRVNFEVAQRKTRGILKILGPRSASSVELLPLLARLVIVESVRKDDGSPQRKQGIEFRRCHSSALLALRAPNTFGIPQVFRWRNFKTRAAGSYPSIERSQPATE